MYVVLWKNKITKVPPKNLGHKKMQKEEKNSTTEKEKKFETRGKWV